MTKACNMPADAAAITRLSHLSIQSGSRVVRGHAMVGHLPPGVVLRGRLGAPHIPSISCNIVVTLYTGLQSLSPINAGQANIE